jgi:hypothetical protein
MSLLEQLAAIEAEREAALEEIIRDGLLEAKRLGEDLCRVYCRTDNIFLHDAHYHEREVVAKAKALGLAAWPCRYEGGNNEGATSDLAVIQVPR